MERTLFVCVHNSGRSQIAEAIFNAMAPPGLEAISAGTAPEQVVDPTVVDAMREIGVEMSGHSPKRLTVAMAESADRIISMGCGVEASCPVGLPITEDWGIEDPAGQPVERVREIRDGIRRRVEDLVRSLRCDAVQARAEIASSSS
jgi:arsenate reductase